MSTESAENNQMLTESAENRNGAKAVLFPIVPCHAQGAQVCDSPPNKNNKPSSPYKPLKTCCNTVGTGGPKALWCGHLLMACTASKMAPAHALRLACPASPNVNRLLWLLREASMSSFSAAHSTKRGAGQWGAAAVIAPTTARVVSWFSSSRKASSWQHNPIDDGMLVGIHNRKMPPTTATVVSWFSFSSKALSWQHEPYT
eukprot:4058243-Pyramimonas_sp.AAC.1